MIPILNFLDMEANADLTREITSNTEQTMEELQSQTERKVSLLICRT